MVTSPRDVPPPGAFYTPQRWARWAVETCGVHQAWADGATVLDPTAGEGALLEAVVRAALDRGVTVTDEMMSRLHGVELSPDRLGRLNRRLEPLGLGVPAQNLVQADFLLDRLPLRADVLLGNPPWINYVDLPGPYRDATRPLFWEYGLVESGRAVLLGASRVDLAALVICRALRENLQPGGRAFFFLPLSLLLNDGAHDAFRGYQIEEIDFSVDEVWDLADEPVFDGVSTRYGLAAFTRDSVQRFPLPYNTRDAAGQRWQRGQASPAPGHPRGPLRVDADDEAPAIRVPRRSQPRQGVNTCGANAALVFGAPEPAGPGVVRVAGAGGEVELEAELVFPLVGPEQLRGEDAPPRRCVLLPHDRATGKPLEEERLRRSPLVWAYLLGQRELLCRRRGVMINSWIGRGRWWALLGVGPYSFAPFKVLWQAYGERRFQPRLLTDHEGQPWQGNQAMHALMPFWDDADASAALDALRHPAVEQALLQQRMAGTRNWAQPGRIKRLLLLED